MTDNMEVMPMDRDPVRVADSQISGKAPWHQPEIKRIEIKRTLALGGSPSDALASGVFNS
jgi:hypothetical protein